MVSNASPGLPAGEWRLPGIFQLSRWKARLGLVLRASDSSIVKWSIQPTFALGPLDALSFDPAGRLYVFDYTRTLHRFFIRDEGLVKDPTFALTLTSDPRHSYVLPDGRLLVSGEFDSLNEQPTTWIGRLTELSNLISPTSPDVRCRVPAKTR